MSMRQAVLAVASIQDSLIKHDCLVALENVLIERLAIHRSWGEARALEVQQIEDLLDQINREYASLFPDPDPEGPEF